MSYIRIDSKYKYVKGNSKDYIWSDGKHVIDYGSITDKSLVELLYRHWKAEDKEFKEYLLFRLANRLKVELKSEPKKRGISATSHIENRKPNPATAKKNVASFLELAEKFRKLKSRKK